MAQQNTQLFPEWRQAAKSLLAQGLTPGQLITHEQLRQELGITIPAQGTQEQYKKLQIKYMQQVSDLRDHLLTMHRIALCSVQGLGYEVLPPNEQTPYAIQQGSKQIEKAINKSLKLMVFVDHTALSSDEQRKNSDALARAATLKSIIAQSPLDELYDKIKNHSNNQLPASTDN